MHNSPGNNDAANSWEEMRNRAAADKNNEADDLYYSNDDGFTVLTEKFLLERGYCCGNGCINCPYDYKAVPEPKRSELLKKRKDKQESSE